MGYNMPLARARSASHLDRVAIVWCESPRNTGLGCCLLEQLLPDDARSQEARVTERSRHGIGASVPNELRDVRDTCIAGTEKDDRGLHAKVTSESAEAWSGQREAGDESLNGTFDLADGQSPTRSEIVDRR